ncbi:MULTISPECIES: helix-turn-helix domain-containing protein [Niastella]|uniref:AraC family transcriptional regulator n=1 Tax=Niastella soli TaxID=2821487 RepID=A0ABS3YZM7_9BACT|nr:helix-turn-helix domain-containing protein [Niastella soli]MBO9203203.1 AraC family transcriptional regulator [Niastella soli]
MIEIFDNIRKLYRFNTPCNALADHIEFFSESSLEAMDRYIGTDQFTVTLFPSYTPTIWLNLGSSYLLKNGNAWQAVDERTDILLLRSEIVERRNLPTDNIFTVKFNPGGFETIFGISQTSIGSEIVLVENIIPAAFIKKLKGLGCFEDRKALFENFFLQKLEKNNKRDGFYLQCIKETVHAFAGVGLESAISELAKKLYISEKTLYRCFTKVVGTPPKNFQAITRARTALTNYVANPAHFYPCDHGYYDMSHFYKSVVKFTGQKLSQYYTAIQQR